MRFSSYITEKRKKKSWHKIKYFFPEKPSTQQWVHETLLNQIELYPWTFADSYYAVLKKHCSLSCQQYLNLVFKGHVRNLK